MHNITAYDKGLLIVFVGVITPPCAYHFCLVYGAKIMLNFARIAGYIKLFLAFYPEKNMIGMIIAPV